MRLLLKQLENVRSQIIALLSEDPSMADEVYRLLKEAEEVAHLAARNPKATPLDALVN